MHIKKYFLLMMIVYTTADCAAVTWNISAKSVKKDNDTSLSTSTPIAPESSYNDLRVPAVVSLASSAKSPIRVDIPSAGYLKPVYINEHPYGCCTLLTEGTTTHHGCCNESCEQTPSCCPKWTAFCLGLAVCLPLTVACRSLLCLGAPCCLAYECYYNAHHSGAADEEGELLHAYDLPCMKPCKILAGVPLPKNGRAHEFVTQACRLPLCIPCATFYCYEERARCVCGVDDED